MQQRSGWRVIGSAVVLLWMAGCGSEVDDAAAPSALSSSAARCIAAAAEAPCDLMTAERVRQAVPALPLDAQTEMTDIVGKRCELSWSGGRKMTVEAGQFSMAVDINDTVTLSNVERLDGKRPPAEMFRVSHRTPDAAQKESAGKAAQAAVSDKVADGTLDQKYEDMGRDMARRMIDSVRWDVVDGLGDAAAWGGMGRLRVLDVLVGDVKFSVLADVSDEDDQDRDASIAVARVLLDACS